MESLDRIAQELINRYQKLNPTEKAQMMGEAVRFCRRHRLLSPKEEVMLQGSDMEAKKTVGRKCMLRQAAFQARQKE